MTQDVQGQLKELLEVELNRMRTLQVDLARKKDEIAAHLLSVSGDVERLEAALAVYKRTEETEATGHQDVRGRSDSRASGMSRPERIERLLRAHPKKLFSAREIAEGIGEDLTVNKIAAVSTTLIRMIDRGLVEKPERGRYRWLGSDGQ